MTPSHESSARCRRWTTVLAVAVGMVGLLGAAGCGDETEKVGTGGSTFSASTTGPSTTGPTTSVGADEPPAGDPDITGPIASVALAQTGTGAPCPPSTGSPEDPVSSDDGTVCAPTDTGTTGIVTIRQGTGSVTAASISVRKDTRILRAVGQGWEPATVEDLARGQVVQVWFTGPVAESYPVQATAATIAITP